MTSETLSRLTNRFVAGIRNARQEVSFRETVGRHLFNDWGGCMAAVLL
jgi:hypothetical protein